MGDTPEKGKQREDAAREPGGSLSVKSDETVPRDCPVPGEYFGQRSHGFFSETKGKYSQQSLIFECRLRHGGAHLMLNTGRLNIGTT
ncbi:hypothetical protein [Cedecea neteri]|uniref:hypothetical protein n=1 Tax=Cedecea neteri TaxID=158822 RepID=UPI0014701ED2|nr:hypothetical protein [Cedecea neteri]